MFEADYKDVKLTKVRKFGDIGESDTVRIAEPSGAFLAKGYKDDKDRHEGIMANIAKNSFVLKDGIAHKLSDKDSIFNHISISDGQRLINAFTSFLDVGDVDPK